MKELETVKLQHALGSVLARKLHRPKKILLLMVSLCSKRHNNAQDKKYVSSESSATSSENQNMQHLGKIAACKRYEATT